MALNGTTYELFRYREAERIYVAYNIEEHNTLMKNNGALLKANGKGLEIEHKCNNLLARIANSS